MSTSTSANLGLTLPGSSVHDTRLGDIQAVKSSLITIDSAIANVAAGNASLGGNANIDFTARKLTVSGDILPTTNQTQNIGSPTKRFKGIYVDEAHLSVNTLYLGDTPILGTVADVINIKADPGQSINVKTTGVGATLINSEHNIAIATIGVNADVMIQATGTGSKLRLTGEQSVDITAPEITSHGNSTIAGNENVNGNLTVSGNLIVNGASTIVNTTTVSTKDNIIDINKGQVGSGVSAGKAGLSVDRGDEPAYQMLFDEVDDMFKVGMVGQLQIIASQDFVRGYAAGIAHVHAEANALLPGFLSVSDKAKITALPAPETLYTKTEVTALIASAVSALQSQMYSHG